MKMQFLGISFCKILQISTPVSYTHLKRVLKSVDGLEEKRGKEYLLKQLQKIATPEALLEYMKYEPHEYGDVLFLTGVGKILSLIHIYRVRHEVYHGSCESPHQQRHDVSIQRFRRRVDGKYPAAHGTASAQGRHGHRKRRVDRA